MPVELCRLCQNPRRLPRLSVFAFRSFVTKPLEVPFEAAIELCLHLSHLHQNRQSKSLQQLSDNSRLFVPFHALKGGPLAPLLDRQEVPGVCQSVVAGSTMPQRVQAALQMVGKHLSNRFFDELPRSRFSEAKRIIVLPLAERRGHRWVVADPNILVSMSIRAMA